MSASAGVASFVMAAAVSLAVAVMVAGRVLAVLQSACQQGVYGCVRVAGNAGKEADANLGQSHLGTAADTAADDHFYAGILQESCQCRGRCLPR